MSAASNTGCNLETCTTLLPFFINDKRSSLERVIFLWSPSTTIGFAEANANSAISGSRMTLKVRVEILMLQSQCQSIVNLPTGLPEKYFMSGLDPTEVPHSSYNVISASFFWS